jgi:16S rRNA (uracil1498-N3)-methyltransferase
VAVTPADAQAPLAFVDDLDRPELDAGDRHHLARVLRLRTGDPLNVSDGAGGWRPCRFGDELEPTGPVEVLERPAPPITIAFAVMKGGRPEWAVQKLTELGVDHIRPFTAARSVVRWDDRRAEANLVRMTRVAREAAMQCRRVWLPEISPLATFADVAALPGAGLADRGGAAPTLAHPCILVGPEGGWDPAERAVPLPVVSLGPQVLRAETAALAAAVLLAADRHGLR